MKAILCFIHAAIETIVVVASLLVIDLPLKALSCVVIVAAAVVVYALYPITKKIPCPRWIKNWMNYATSCDKFLTTYIGRMWR